jgi:hypothetical protein
MGAVLPSGAGKKGKNKTTEVHGVRRGITKRRVSYLLFFFFL